MAVLEVRKGRGAVLYPYVITTRVSRIEISEYSQALLISIAHAVLLSRSEDLL